MVFKSLYVPLTHGLDGLLVQNYFITSSDRRFDSSSSGAKKYTSYALY